MQLTKVCFLRTAVSAAHLCAEFFIGYHRNKAPVLPTSIPQSTVVFKSTNSELGTKLGVLRKLNHNRMFGKRALVQGCVQTDIYLNKASVSTPQGADAGDLSYTV